MIPLKYSHNKKSLVKKISYKNMLIAIIIPRNFKKIGVEFFTPRELSQQLGYMHYGAGHEIQAHRHKLVMRHVAFTQEVIFVRSGRIEVFLYSDSKKFLEKTILKKGDIILLVGGGHGFKFLEKSELVEIKQGPYLSFEKDREFFGP